MWNFNNVGRLVEETTLHRGLVARHFNVWPWKRRTLSMGLKYLVTVTNPQGVEIYNNSHSHKILFSYVVSKYQAEVRPLKSWHDDLDVHAFSLATAIESYLGKTLPDGKYLVMIPSSKKVIENFWKEKADEVSMDHTDPHLDCYVANVTEFDGVLSYLVADSYLKYPGRYLLVTMSDGFTQTVEDLI